MGHVTSLSGSYTVGTGDSSSDLSVSSYTIGTVADTAGNAMTSTTVPATNISTGSALVVDGTVPTTTFTGVAYDAASNVLTLTGTNINSLLSGSENSSTDLKAYLDWTKLQWDVDSDNTGNITFALSDISSALATNDTTLTITLGSTKASSLEGTSGYDNLTTNDTVEITAGFSKDSAGNVATTDAYDGPSSINTSIVVFDLTASGGDSSDHSGQTFSAGVTYTIYIMVDSGSSTINLAGSEKWSGGANLGTDDHIILVGNSGGSVIGELGAAVDAFVIGGNNMYWGTSSLYRTTAGGAHHLSASYSNVPALKLSKSGKASRAYSSKNTDTAVLWTGGWVGNPNTGRTTDSAANLGAIYANQLPAGILSSQGLA